MHPVSVEQAAVIKASYSLNVILSSCAGSGKTTTSLALAQKYPDQKILLLTYNSRLRFETKARCVALGITNVDVHTYHSFAYRYIGPQCMNDSGIITFINENGIFLPNGTGCTFDDNVVYPTIENYDGIEDNFVDSEQVGGTIDTYDNDEQESVRDITQESSCESELDIVFDYDKVICDEIQDCTVLYYQLIKKIIAQNIPAKLIIVGDEYQSIYGFSGADARFLTLANKIYRRDNWVHLKLSTSYRVTRQIANLVNCVIGEERMIAVKDGPLPNYTIINCFKPFPIIDEIKSLLKIYKPDDIFVLAPSVKTKETSPVRVIANALTRAGIKIYLPSSDDSKLDEQVMAGKIVFSSFHQTKGLERKCVIILSFDSSYFSYFAKGEDSNKCPNVIYVALTRAITHLSVYASSKAKPFNFIDLTQIAKLTNFKGKAVKLAIDKPQAQKAISVTMLTDHLSSKILYACMELIQCNVLKSPAKLINIPLKTKQTSTTNGKTRNHFEECSDISGVAIPMYYEYKKTGKITGVDKIPPEPTTEDFLRIANNYLARKNELSFKVAQITQYNWLTDKILQSAYVRTTSELDKYKNKQFEVDVEVTVLGQQIKGRIDVLADDLIIELKTVGALQPENFLQVAIYGYMYHIMFNKQLKCHLFNIRTDELVEILPNPVNMENVIKMIICSKYHKKDVLSDKAFLASIGVEASDEELNKCRTCETLKDV